jgi:hypothetical protein
MDVVLTSLLSDKSFTNAALSTAPCRSVNSIRWISQENIPLGNMAYILPGHQSKHLSLRHCYLFRWLARNDSARWFRVRESHRRSVNRNPFTLVCRNSFWLPIVNRLQTYLTNVGVLGWKFLILLLLERMNDYRPLGGDWSHRGQGGVEAC